MVDDSDNSPRSGIWSAIDYPSGFINITIYISTFLNMKQDKGGILKNKKRQILSRVILVFLGLLVGFLCVEAGLRVAEALKVDWLFFASEGINQYTIPDKKLGMRIAPNAPGHDANGFRNKAVPERVDIVAIGDSQTWGVNAKMSEAWPQKLAALSGHSVYNMGLGYYNPVEYWALTEEASQLSPDIIVIGLYFGNDLWGAYNRVYTDETYFWLRNSQTDSEPQQDTVLPKILDITTKWDDYASWLEKSILADVGRELNKRSRTLRLLWRSWRILNDSQYKADKAWAFAHPDVGVLYEKDNVRAVLGPGYRLPSLDLDDPCIVEGMRITKELLLLIQKETKARNIKLLILLIPTQESAYASVVEKLLGQLTPTYAKMVEMETRARNEVISLSKENAIQYVDALPALTEAIQHGEKIYPREINGHPLPQGYSVISSVVNNELNRLGWLE